MSVLIGLVLASRHDPFTRIMLKFPQVAQAFNSVRTTFEELDATHKGYIEFADMQSAFERLSVTFTKEEISQVLQESDMIEDGRICFKEFLVCLAIGFVLQVCSTTHFLYCLRVTETHMHALRRQ